MPPRILCKNQVLQGSCAGAGATEDPLRDPLSFPVLRCGSLQKNPWSSQFLQRRRFGFGASGYQEGAHSGGRGFVGGEMAFKKMEDIDSEVMI